MTKPESEDPKTRETQPEEQLPEEELGDVSGGLTAMKGSSGGFTFPDVCKTPLPSGGVPIPFPNLGTQSGASGESGETDSGGNDTGTSSGTSSSGG